MVVKDFYNLLKDDYELSSLIGATAADSKIYPIQMPYNTTLPCILYKLVDDSTLDENIYDAILQYDCISDKFDTCISIKDRLLELIDKNDDINDLIINGYFYYYWSKLTAFFSFKEPELDIFHNIMIFEIRYNDIYGFLLQENSFYLLQENGFNFRIT